MPKTITGLSSKETQTVLYLYHFIEEGIAEVFGDAAVLVKQVKDHLSECSECTALVNQDREQRRRDSTDLRPSTPADKTAKEFIELQAIRNMAGEDQSFHHG